MRGVLIFMYCISVLANISLNVKFIHEPKDSCIPWRGQSQLICKVDHPRATYSWLTIRHAPLDLIFLDGRLHFLKESDVLFEKSEAVVENSSFISINPFDGRLLLKHPTSVDKINRSKSLMINYNSWLEGSYRCKASIPGHGSLVSRAANIRLSDLFLEPNLPTTHGLLSNSHQPLITEFQQYSTASVSAETMTMTAATIDSNKHPGLGGGSFYPGELVVLRCPLITISSVKPIIRWFHVTSDVMVMQPVGFDTDLSHSTWPNSYEAITLDGGRWLEIHLGYLNTSTTTSQNHQFDQSKWNENLGYFDNDDADKKLHPNEHYFRAGFGEYFCEVHIPALQQENDIINQSVKMGLNNTGPYIPVTLFTSTSSPSAFSSTSSSSSSTPVNKSQSSNPNDIIHWSVQPVELVQVEFPSTFMHSVELISTAFSRNVKNQQIHLDQLQQQKQPFELWRKVNSSVTLLCASNIRQFNSDNRKLHRSGALWFNSSRLGDGGYGIQWTKDGEVLSDKLFQTTYSRFRVVASASLLINNVQHVDTGVYSCQVVNRILNSVFDERSIKLIIGSSPVLIDASSDELQAKLHFEQLIWCKFKSDYVTIIQWRKNGELIQDSEYFRIINNFTKFFNSSNHNEEIITQIKIQRILQNDSGYFQCLAENRFGSIQYTINLNVVQSNSIDYINDGIDNSMFMIIPTNVRVWNISDTHAYVMWDEPQWYLSKPLMYFLQIESDDSSGHLTVNTTKSVVLLADLQPETKYTLKIFPGLSQDFGELSNKNNNFASVHFITKPLIHRPAAVKDIVAESWKYGTLTISWKTPLPDDAGNVLEDKIASYQIILRSLTSKPNDDDDNNNTADFVSHKPIGINVRTSELITQDDRLSYTVLDLTPDAFYQITVYPISEGNITGRVAYLTSSPRVASRPPSKPPMNVHVHSIGAHVATVSWQPPPMKYRNGQLIVYRINISCEDWLRSRFIMVRNKLSQLIQGLTSGTEYELTVSAATRAGNGPDSEILTFTTMTQKNEADIDAENNKNTDGYMLSNDALSEDFATSIVDHHQQQQKKQQAQPSLSDNKQSASSSLGPVENLKWLAEEHSLLIMWSPPVPRMPSNSRKSINTHFNPPLRSKVRRGTNISHYIVSWGKMHPGPDSVELPRNQTSYSIQKLDQDTTYFIKVVVVGKNQEMKEAFISARTKPSSPNEHLPIPLNLHVSSSDSNWAILTWDKPECIQQSQNTYNNINVDRIILERSQPNQLMKASLTKADCSKNNNKQYLIKFYQVAYQIIGYASNRTKTNNVNGRNNVADDIGDKNGVELLSNVNHQQVSRPPLDKTQYMISVTENWVKLENLQFGRLYSVVVRAVGEKNLNNLQVITTNDNQELNNLLYSEWSLEQIIETPEQKPSDSPRDISLIGLTGVGSSDQQQDQQSVSIQISWQPPLHPNGPLTGYLLYFTMNHSLPLLDWSKRRLPPDSLNTVISGLSYNAIYAFRLKATNLFGDGPISSVKFYRTPDIYGQGGGTLTLSDHEYAKLHSSISSTSLKQHLDDDDRIVNYPADLIFVKQPINDAKKHRSNMSAIGTVLYSPVKNSWLIIGIMIGFLIIILIIIMMSLLCRKHRRHFSGPLMNYKLGHNLSHLPEGDNLTESNTATHRNNTNNTSNSLAIQSFGRKRKCLTKSSFGAGAIAGNQDVALLMSNGEALLAASDYGGVGQQQQSLALSSNLMVSSGGLLVTTMSNMLTTSMNLSGTVGGASSGVSGSGAGQVSSTAITPNQGILYNNNQNNINAGSYSWDHDSDSLQFASVSQERTRDNSGQSPNITTGHGQNTPTNAGSVGGSTNSAHGSIGTPTRIVPNLAYHHEVHGFPNDAALGGYSYPTVSLIPNIVNPMLVASRPPSNNNNNSIAGYYPGHLVPSVIPSNNINNYLVQYYPTTSMFNQHPSNCRMPIDRFPSMVASPPPQMVYTGQSSGRYPNAMPFNIDQSQVATYAHVINPSYTTNQPGFVNVNTPRVNAAEIMSFTSSEDIGAAMSGSVNENDSEKFLSSNGDDYSRSKTHNNNVNYTHTTPKSRRTSSSATGSRSITSPRRRPLPNSNRNERNTDIHSNGSIADHQNPMNRSNNSSINSNNAGNNNTMVHSVKQGSNRNSVIVNHDGPEGEHEGVQKAFSSEELSQEMANLEGLMKDLSAIAQEEFNY